MSVVVALKHRGVVYVGCDSQVTYGYSKMTLTNPNNYKIWKVLNSSNTIMGGVGTARDACVVRLMTNLNPKKKDIDFKEVVNNVVVKISKKLFNLGYTSLKDNKLENMDSSFLLATKNSIFEIDCDHCVTEIDDYIAIGSGDSEAMGSFTNTVGEKPEVRVIKAVKAACNFNLYVNYPIILSNTRDCKMKVLNEKDVEKILKGE